MKNIFVVLIENEMESTMLRHYESIILHGMGVENCSGATAPRAEACSSSSDSIELNYSDLLRTKCDTHN